MNELAQIKKNAGIQELEEGRVFNNTGEMLRTLLNDVKQVSSNISSNSIGVADIQSELNDIVEYYMNAEIKSTPRY